MIVSENWANKAKPFLPIGLGTIASELRKSGHEVKIVDALTEGWDKRWRLDGNWIEIGLAEEDIAAAVREFRPQVVGFSIPLTTQLPRVISLANWVKAIHPEILVVCGGNHATASPRELLEIPAIDIVVLGEGEMTFKQTLEKLEKNINLEQQDGIAFRRQDNSVVLNPVKQYIENLDSLPLPAYEMLPLKKYFKISGKRIMPFFTSRGCKNRCAYCTTHQQSGKLVRHFSPMYLLKHIRHLIENYGVHEFYFEDHGLFIDKAYAISLLKTLKSGKTKFLWNARNGVDPCGVENGLLSLLKSSGCKRLYFNPDSGSRRILSKCLSKPFNPFITEQAIKRTLDAGIKVSCQFVLGSPGETIDEIYETLNFAWKLRSLGVDEFEFSLAVPYVGTKLRRQAESKNSLLPVPEQMHTPDTAMIATQQLSTADLIRIRDTAEREFNNRGLVVSLKPKKNVAAKQPVITEDRLFYSVAPQPSIPATRLKPDLVKTPA